MVKVEEQKSKSAFEKKQPMNIQQTQAIVIKTPYHMISHNNLHIFYTDIAKLLYVKLIKVFHSFSIVIVVSHQLLPPYHLSTTMLYPLTGYPNIWHISPLLRTDILQFIKNIPLHLDPSPALIPISKLYYSSGMQAVFPRIQIQKISTGN